MGLFDKVLGSGTQTLEPAEGFAGVALCAIASDGMITQEEAAGLGTTLSRMKLFTGMSARQINGVFEKLIKVVRADGVDALLARSAEVIPADLKPTAFAVAADLVMADGSVEGAEKAFLEKLQKALAVDETTALKVVEVLSIKNRG